MSEVRKVFFARMRLMRDGAETRHEVLSRMRGEGVILQPPENTMEILYVSGKDNSGKTTAMIWALDAFMQEKSKYVV